LINTVEIATKTFSRSI